MRPLRVLGGSMQVPPGRSGLATGRSLAPVLETPPQDVSGYSGSLERTIRRGFSQLAGPTSQPGRRGEIKN